MGRYVGLTINKGSGGGGSVQTEAFTRATGIKSLTKLAMSATGYKDCGCDKRKAWLNKQFPYYKQK